MSASDMYSTALHPLCTFCHQSALFIRPLLFYLFTPPFQPPLLFFFISGPKHRITRSAACTGPHGPAKRQKDIGGQAAYPRLSRTGTACLAGFPPFAGLLVAEEPIRPPVLLLLWSGWAGCTGEGGGRRRERGEQLRTASSCVRAGRLHKPARKNAK